MSGDEHESLLGGGSYSSRGRNQASGSSNKPLGILLNRIFVLIVLAGAVAASVYFQSEVTTLRGELTREEKTVQELQEQVQLHAQVIQRFNESVTNADVMAHLQSLESELDSTQDTLEHEMDKLESKVSDQLDSTLEELGDTVTQARQEIEEQVEKVKKDVDQYVVKTQDQFSMENSFMVYQIAGTLTLLSCLISMWHMTAHLSKMHEPVVQRKILAILWMSPIYAVTSWFSLVFHSAEGYLAIVKDGYEAYVIYQFLSFCIAVLGKGDRGKVVDILSKRADHLTPPFRLCRCCEREDPYANNQHALADAILLQCQLFAMQFVFLRPLLTIATVVLAKLNYYGAGDGPHDYRSPQFYIVIVQNISVFTAFAGLLKFYHAVDKDLQWCRPFAKFLCIKGVVFMTFWQGLAISVLAETTDVGGEDQADDWAKSSQNFLICLEMLLFSIAHFYCFPTDEWSPDYRQRVKAGFAESLALGDFYQDLKLLLRSNKKKGKKPKEPTVPEGNQENTEDDETDKSSVSSLHGKSEEDLENAIQEGIRENGVDENDDDEVAQAKARLAYITSMPSSMADMADGSEEARAGAEDKSGEEADHKNWKELPSEPNETTGLLSENCQDDSSSGDENEIPRTKNEEVLKPSIFTLFGQGKNKK